MAVPVTIQIRRQVDLPGQGVSLVPGSGAVVPLISDARSASWAGAWTSNSYHLDPAKVLTGYDDDGTTAIADASKCVLYVGEFRGLWIDLWYRWFVSAATGSKGTITSGSMTGYLYGWFPFMTEYTGGNTPGATALGTTATDDTFLNTVSGTWVPLPDESGNFLLTLANSSSIIFREKGAGILAATPSERGGCFTPPLTVRTRGARKLIFLPAAFPTQSVTPNAAQILGRIWS